ncbi:MAG TPA: M20/M25/M40 family metallo-hydrolase [Bacteroidales bacterium]|nr:M20/M25/M40 family metallo-hydrolase [Bacteroidales bacterium]HOH83113.1 M20/M25/M40 family metallo-hydrolase [Bacteroidales bacterium]
MRKVLWLGLFLLITGMPDVFSQAYQLPDAAAVSRIKDNIGILAADSMMGRESGTPGEYMARKYIAAQFKEIGLAPLFDTSYFESFTFSDVDFLDLDNTMEVNGKKLQLYSDYYPIGFSANDTVSGEMVFAGTGILCESAGINDYIGLDLKGKIAVIDLAVPGTLLEKKNVWDSSQKVVRVNRAMSLGAVGVVFVSTEKNYGTPSKDPNFYKERVKIPVVFVCDSSIIMPENPGKAFIITSIDRSGLRRAYNVGGFIDNGSENTVVIGAHYDHVGLGYFGARDPGDNTVHNGADDNASGVAGVLELARMLKSAGPKSNNYAFLAFSGEEKGLIGSEKFITNGSVKKERINYMVDLDMIGRLDAKKKIKIYGTGTADLWENALNTIGDKGFKITRIKTGIGGSDHYSFNQHQIPAIFIHTGLHEDYHKAVDDTHLINFKGAQEVIKYAYEIIRYLDDKGKITFTIASMLDEMMLKK